MYEQNIGKSQQINHDIVVASKGRASAVNLWIPVSNGSEDMKTHFPGFIYKRHFTGGW
jgi:hypothetical protein